MKEQLTINLCFGICFPYISGAVPLPVTLQADAGPPLNGRRGQDFLQCCPCPLPTEGDHHAGPAGAVRGRCPALCRCCGGSRWLRCLAAVLRVPLCPRLLAVLPDHSRHPAHHGPGAAPQRVQQSPAAGAGAVRGRCPALCCCRLPARASTGVTVLLSLLRGCPRLTAGNLHAGGEG